jgi:hypothetical protein
MKNTPLDYWNGKKIKLMQKYPLLTKADMTFNLGKEKEMIELLGYKLGMSQQALLQIIVSI